MKMVLGTLDKDTSYEVTYMQSEDGSIYERRPNLSERFFCSQKLWPSTLAHAALDAQQQQIDIITYWKQQGLLQQNSAMWSDDTP